MAGRRRPSGYKKIKKSAKTHAERPEDEPTCAKYVDTFLVSYRQHDSDDEDTTITRACAVSENNEDAFVSIPDQDQVCHDAAELLQPEQAGNDKFNQQQDVFLDDTCQNLKKNRKMESLLPIINWLK